MLARTIRRRQFLSLTGLAAGTAAAGGARAFAAPLAPAPKGADLGLLDEFRTLPGKKSAQIDVGDPQRPWRAAYKPDAQLFCGSCFKTFVLATYLQEVEADRLTETEQLDIDDSVRSVGGAVFDFLTGTTAARNVLDAMIAHSDNTATDVAMARVGVDKVRAFIKSADLRDTRIPDSTRRFFSYISGYPPGEDMGWKGLVDLEAGKTPGPGRPAVNDVQTMVCPASQFVSYYKRARRRLLQEAGDAYRVQAHPGHGRRHRGRAAEYARLPQGRQHRLERFPLHGDRRADDRRTNAGHVLPHAQLARERRQEGRCRDRLQEGGRRHPRARPEAAARSGGVA